MFSIPQMTKRTGRRPLLRQGLIEERPKVPIWVLSQTTVVDKSQQRPIRSAKIVSSLQTMKLKTAGII